MQLQITEIKPANEKWFDFISSHPQGNYFQSPSFIQTISDVPGYRPVHLFLLNSSDRLMGVLCGVIQQEGSGIKAKMSSRLICWGGPLVHENRSDLMKYLVEQLLSSFKKNIIYIEFRNLFEQKANNKSFHALGFAYKPHINYLVKLDNPVAVKKRMSESKLRQIKSSIKNGAVIEEVITHSDLVELYSGLSELYRSKIRKPLAPLKFFENFMEETGSGRIFIIKYQGELIGGIVCPVYLSEYIYEWYVYGHDGLIKGIFPSVLATWAPIEYGLRVGLKQFDFLGAGSPDKDYGVREFKSKFGGTEVEYGRFIKLTRPTFYYLGKIGVFILGKLKMI